MTEIRDTDDNKMAKTPLTSGIVAAICSALLFGISPAIAKLAYEGGSNAVTMTFTRALFSIPVLFLIARSKKIALHLTKKETIALVPVSLFGAFFTTILLYSSYAYIGVGTATVLHYIFPVLVMFGGVIFFKEKIFWWKILALALGFLGVLSFIGEQGQNDPRGMILALLSSVSYAGLMIGIEQSAMRHMQVIKVAFYTNIISAIASLCYGLLSHSLQFSMTAAAWGYSVLVSMMVAIGAFSLLNFAIVKAGASTTSIIAMLEPLTGVFFGFLILKETISWMNAIGFILITVGVVIVSVFSSHGRAA